MAIRPRTQTPQTSYTSDFLSNEGFRLPDSTSGYQTAPYPVSNPPFLVGVDYVQASLPAGPTTVTFPNLPIRGTGNPSAPKLNQPQTITVNPGDLLIFVVSSSGGVTVTPRIVDTSNTIYTSPAVSTGTYRAFQAIVTAPSSTNAIVYGTLYIHRGVLTS